MNTIARLEFELTYCDVTAKHFCHDTKMTSFVLLFVIA